MMFVAPTQKNSAMAATTTIHTQLSNAVYNPTLQNISKMLRICTPIRTLSGSECTSSQKLMPQISTRPHRNGRYS